MGSGAGVPGGVMGGIGAAPAPVVKIAPPKGPARVSSGVISGLKISGANPTYPPIARQTQIESDVKLALKLSAKGEVLEASVLSGHPMLKEAALSNARLWRFACLDCAWSEPFTHLIVYSFRIDKSGTVYGDSWHVKYEFPDRVTLFQTPVLLETNFHDQPNIKRSLWDRLRRKRILIVE